MYLQQSPRPGSPPPSGRRAKNIPDGVPPLEAGRPRAVRRPGFNGPRAAGLPELHVPAAVNLSRESANLAPQGRLAKHRSSGIPILEVDRPRAAGFLGLNMHPAVNLS